jgi:hypothetical protein
MRDESPEIVEIERLISLRGGMIETRQLVEAARDPSSVLHRHFTWDDRKAADERRLSQARQLIRRYEVTIVTSPDAPPISASRFTHVKMWDSDDAVNQGYARTVDLLADPVRRKIVLERAKREAASWAERYRHLEELAEVLAAIAKAA